MKQRRYSSLSYQAQVYRKIKYQISVLMNGSWKPNTEKYQANFDLLTVYNGDEKPIFVVVVVAAVARLSKEWRECYVIELLMR